MPTSSSSNFTFLQSHDEPLAPLGMLAETYLADDPDTCLLKLRQFGELLAQTIAVRMKLYKTEAESQNELLRRLRDENVLTREVYDLFGEIRRAGDDASLAGSNDAAQALNTLKIA